MVKFYPVLVPAPLIMAIALYFNKLKKLLSILTLLFWQHLRTNGVQSGWHPINPIFCSENLRDEHKIY
jgi:hypothetical protein